MVNRSDVIERAQGALGYTFQNPDFLITALTHASIADSRVLSNERLEFLGDAVLGLIVCEELFRQYPNYLEGELTKIKSVVVSRKVCADVATKLGLPDLLFLGKGIADRKRIPMSLRAASIESIIAALYLDGGIEVARQFVLTHLKAYIEDAVASENQQNYKSHLQQYAQKFLAATPQYDTLDEQGPDHNKCFEVCVYVGDRRFRSAWGSSKKEAEQLAAMLALQEISRDQTLPGNGSGLFPRPLVEVSEPVTDPIIEGPGCADSTIQEPQA